MLNFFLGFVAPFLIVALWMLVGHLFSRNLKLECDWCSGSWGMLPHEAHVAKLKPTFTYATKFRFWLHKFRCVDER